MFNKHDISRDTCQLFGEQAHCGYDWWWHSFTGHKEGSGEEKAFFVEYFLCNPALGGEEPVFGQLPENKENGVKPSYLMVKAGAWGNDAAQLHRFFGWKQIEVNWDIPYIIRADDCFATETSIRGSIDISPEEAAAHPEWMCQSGSMKWDLRIDKQIAFNVGYGADKAMRDIQAFEMFWHAEGMKSAFEGDVIWNGDRYIISPETSYGYADKNWGKDFTSPWIWINSCNLTSEVTGKKLEDSVFDIGGGRPKVGHLALPRKLLAAFWYEGTPYEFNFSKVWTHTHTEFECRETDTQIIWHIEQHNRHDRMVTDLTCEKEDMLLVQYEAPNGEKKHNRLWNGGNGKGTVELYHAGELVDRIRVENAGCEYGEYTEEPSENTDCEHRKFTEESSENADCEHRKYTEEPMENADCEYRKYTKEPLENAPESLVDTMSGSRIAQSINIRQMTIDDYDNVYALWTSCKNMGLNNLDDSREGIGKLLARNPSTCFVAEENSVIIGVILTGHDGRRGFIYHMAVADDHRRQGIGGSLLDHALAALKEEGINKVALVVFKRNDVGNAFWESRGFTVREDLNYRNMALTEIIRMDT